MDEPKRYWCQEGTMLATTTETAQSVDPLYVRAEHYDNLHAIAKRMDSALCAIYEESAQVLGVSGDRIRKMIRDCGREVGQIESVKERG